MNMIKDGGPAFPVDHAWYESQSGTPEWYCGMTLRDYFAAKAMARGFAIKSLSERDGFQKMCAEQAYTMADAMLAAREAQP